ncbi:MAG: SagB/ThcOx family dehydrogenase [Deltaproteobacteria bacterium]|nr:SagB/ThcOx family dehydrogenase [Deltaproteobacteria bacterium]
MLTQSLRALHEYAMERVKTISLPTPAYDSGTSVEKSLRLRRSVREYRGGPLTLAQVAQLLWAAQGVTDPGGLRTAPSAGALYPLEARVVSGNIDGLPAGIYHYRSLLHELIRVIEGDKRGELYRSSLGQPAVGDAALLLVFSGVYERTVSKYGQRGLRYVHMEAGHAAQNVCLQAVSLRLGVVMVGAFEDSKVKKVLSLDATEEPLYILAIGRI